MPWSFSILANVNLVDLKFIRSIFRNGIKVGRKWSNLISNFKANFYIIFDINKKALPEFVSL